MKATPLPVVRCAIYTRKSSEEGLDQAFNSLHAQREACEAYVKSQVGEGWLCLKTEYDDGGISGGTMDRPSLKRLLADIEDGQISVVVVYKVDRLTRSLADFARIIDVFDRKGVSFVSVTQAFNTTSSMGRLTLNVLLSFAQFEREVTGERIRDKIAASKAKGMWMGGMPPLGYDIPEDRMARKLKVNEPEAAIVRDIYQRYLRLKSVNALRDELAQDGVLSKAWVTGTGRAMGGKTFSTGSLFHLLQSRVYLGEIVHGVQRYPGVHEAIVDQATFDAAEAQLAANARARAAKSTQRSTLPLQGLVFDADGNRMTPTFGYGKAGKRHAYYVSAPLLSAGKLEAGTIGRVPAEALGGLLLSRLRLLTTATEAEWPDVVGLVKRVSIEGQSIRLELTEAVLQTDSLSFLRSRLPENDRLTHTRNGHHLELIISVRPVFRGGRTWMVRPDGAVASGTAKPDRGLLKALAQTHQGLAALNAGPTCSAEQWRQAKSVPDSYLRQLTGFAFLAPDIQRAILDGRQPAGLTALQILRRGVPLAWADQRLAFGFSG